MLLLRGTVLLLHSVGVPVQLGGESGIGPSYGPGDHLGRYSPLEFPSDPEDLEQVTLRDHMIEGIPTTIAQYIISFVLV